MMMMMKNMWINVQTVIIYSTHYLFLFLRIISVLTINSCC